MADTDGPAFAHIPAGVRKRLRPHAARVIRDVHTWVEDECVGREKVMEAQVERDRWSTPPLMRELRRKAKARGLWNLFLPETFEGSPGLSNLEYGCVAELLGRCYWAQQTVNCHAPETGNIELMAKFCTPEQKEKWLRPIMEGTASSAYSMTEPDAATSDAVQVGLEMRREGDEYVLNGRKLFANCLWNRDLAFYIVMGRTDAANPDPWRRHSMVIVPCDTPGIEQVRNLNVLGYHWAPEGHGEYTYTNVRVPAANLILGPGRAFEIAQGRLGGGRVHHCMRLLGQCERAVELAVCRATDARFRPRGKLVGAFDSNVERLGRMRMELDAMRLVVLNAAEEVDIRGAKAAQGAVAQCKVLVPRTVEGIVNECMQFFGGQGVTNEHTPLPRIWAYARWSRLADGPDAAHRHQVGRNELKKGEAITRRHRAYKDKAKKFAELYGEKFTMQPEDTL